MKPATVKELKEELSTYPNKELMDLCLKLAKFKKDNKELLTYLLFDSKDEEGYIRTVKKEIDEQFAQINRHRFHFIKKGIQKVLRFVKKQMRYSQRKETEIELLMHFCQHIRDFDPPIGRSVVLSNLYDRQINQIRNRISKLHEDLQYDYEQELAALE